MKEGLVRKLMRDFAESTGVSGESPPRRYLWTDAFGVCNFLGLYEETRDEQYIELALTLVDQVHHVLGRHRDDDRREGWISGLPEQEGERHPTMGGLRIGKKLPERAADEPVDSRLEWDRDGQYFHYLTKWMHALDCMAAVTGETRYWRWARELAAAAHQAFCYQAGPDGPPRMYWKMSIDLSRPLVPSMGQHDPLDGLVSYLELRAAAPAAAEKTPDLTQAIEETSAMCRDDRWRTEDPLGIGGLLDAASRLARLVFDRGVNRRPLLERILTESKLSLRAFARSELLDAPPERRLAFRELGLAIGLEGLFRAQRHVQQDTELTALIQDLLEHYAVGKQIEAFWSEPTHRQNRTWTDHCDINNVMLATSLAAESYFRL
ncbi:MAG: hypothetical protein ACQESR_11100 [Planctomycetota bacterium]